MKLPLFLLILMACVSFAQIPAPTPHASFSIEVKEIGTGRNQSSNWETDYGSYDRDYSQFKQIEYRITNMGRIEGSCTVRVYFIVKKLANDERKIFSMVSNTHKIGVMQFINHAIDSGDIKSNVLKLSAIGETWVSGTKTDGWILIATNEAGDVIFTKASSQTLQSLTESKKDFAKLGDDYKTAAAQ